MALVTDQASRVWLSAKLSLFKLWSWRRVRTVWGLPALAASGHGAQSLNPRRWTCGQPEAASVAAARTTCVRPIIALQRCRAPEPVVETERGTIFGAGNLHEHLRLLAAFPGPAPGQGRGARGAAAVAATYAAALLIFFPPAASLDAPHAPGGLVGTIAQAHNIELVLYQP